MANIAAEIAEQYLRGEIVAMPLEPFCRWEQSPDAGRRYDEAEAVVRSVMRDWPSVRDWDPQRVAALRGYVTAWMELDSLSPGELDGPGADAVRDRMDTLERLINNDAAVAALGPRLEDWSARRRQIADTPTA